MTDTTRPGTPDQTPQDGPTAPPTPAPDSGPTVTIPDDERALEGSGKPQPRPYDEDTLQEEHAPGPSLSAFAALGRGPDLPDSPRTRAEQMAFLRDAHKGPLVWRRLCQSLTRQAPGLPAVYGSARAALLAMPTTYRVTHIEDLRRGMSLGFGTPTDDNPFDHIVTVAGWDKEPSDNLDDLFTWTNDALRPGGVDLVRASFFPEHWGDPFMWGGTSLNGYDLPGYQRPKPTPPPVTVGARLDHAIADLRKAIRHHRAAGHPAIVNALVRDLRELKETRARFPKR